MSLDHYPRDIVLTVEDFLNCGWETALTGVDHHGYPSMRDAFSAAERQAIAEDRKTHGKALRLLADACSMKLSPNSANKPFKPFIVFHAGRSIIPGDLLEDDITFFAHIVDEIDDPWLKARLPDLVWFIQRPCKVRFALEAIDSYRSIPLDTKTWWCGGQECWQRAIYLVCTLKAGAGDRLAQMEASIIDAFELVTKQDGFLAFKLADLLKSNALAGSHSTKIATKLESLAHEFKDEGNFYSAREYFQASSGWFKTAGDDAKSVEMTVAVAEGWAKEAAARASSNQPSYAAAASFYEKAIQTYRTIPHSDRANHQVAERIIELREHLNESGKKSLDEMNVVSTPDVDISQIAEDARNSVKGKGTVEALKAFANLHSVTDAKELRESAIKNLHNYPLQTLFPTTVIGRDGRVIAKRPGMGNSAMTSDADEVVIRSEMSQNYAICVPITVQGRIWPALEVLLLEHLLREADFIDLAKQSPIVPMERELLFGKALFAGYDRDFVTAIHILVPQIEYMVRFHLKQAGVKTTNLDNNGIENENGLNSLMALPETEKVFGEDLSFEIESLFCDPAGPNLRNELAHGLIDDDALQSIYVIYAWWLGLKLVFNTFWNASRSDTESSEQEQGP